MQMASLHRIVYTSLPSDADIGRIPLARMAEFSLNDKDTAALRRHLYAINRDGVRRYRTLRENDSLLVWRIK